MLKKNKDNFSGFSFIEILVVFAILSILAGAIIVNFGKNVDNDLRIEKNRFITFLREVQNKAISGEVVPERTGTVCGFGVHYDSSNKAIVYYIQTFTKNDSCSNKGKLFSDGLSFDAESFFLKNGITFESKFSDLFFLIPNGEVYYDNLLFTDPINPQVINLSKDEKSIPVSIYSSGRIE